MSIFVLRANIREILVILGSKSLVNSDANNDGELLARCIFVS